MKKILSSICIALILTLGFFWLVDRDLTTIYLKGMTSRNANLTYLVYENVGAKFSFKPEDSDYSANQSLLDHLVGTLVKYGPTGHPEPYLAESWTVSQNKKVWTFKLRNLVCEDGRSITAAKYSAQLQYRLKSLADDAGMIDFDQLSGWHDYLNGSKNSVEGISVLANTIEFKFDRRPEDFLETLRKVMFGYWCGELVDGRYSDASQFVSSGAYSVYSISEEQSVIQLKRKSEWFSLNPDSPETITFTSGPLPNENKGPVILALGPVPKKDLPEAYVHVQSTPDQLIAISIHPKKDNIFLSLENRMVFQNRLYSYLNANKLETNTVVPAKSFFPHRTYTQEIQDVSSLDGKYRAMDRELAIRLSSNLPTEALSFIESALKFALPANQKFRIAVIDRTDKNWAKKFMNAVEMDIRIPTVGVGEFGRNSAIKMMFCTGLGVNFADPTGKICKLVERYESQNLELDQKYFEDFQQALWQGASVIPLFHTGKFYVISKNIDLESIAPQLTVPRLDLLRLK